MIELRPYQTAAIDAIYDYFQRATGNPLVVLPTGTGKSVVIAKFVQDAIAAWPDTRVLMLTHVRELIQQNFAELIGLWPDAPAGIYSAGLGRRDIGARILYAGIQSIHKKAYHVQQCDLVLVDEAHLIPRSSNTMYGRFLAQLREINPHLKIIGFTATPYRLDSGMLHEGDGAIFDAIAYDANVLDMIEQGYLCPVVPRETDAQLDTSGVGTRGGEFIAGELEAAVDQEDLNRAVTAEIIKHGEDRGSWLIFCAGVRHAEHVAECVRDAGYSCETVTGDTPKNERDRIIRDFKAGKLRAVTNANVLTTGFNAPGVDLIAMLRPTKSTGLYVQMIGRGTRIVSGKDNCLVLDFAGNTARHGPIDKVNPKKPGRGDGKAPTKTCPECKTIVFAGVRLCPECDHEFPAPEPDLAVKPSSNAILSSQLRTEWTPVSDVTYARHEKPGKPPSMRVEYLCGLNAHREWICFEHSGYPRQKAAQWWSRRMPGQPVPATVAEALAAASGLPRPTMIAIRPSGRYTEITGHRFE